MSAGERVQTTPCACAGRWARMRERLMTCTMPGAPSLCRPRHVSLARLLMGLAEAVPSFMEGRAVHAPVPRW